MKLHFLHAAEDRDQPGQDPLIDQRMRIRAKVDRLPDEGKNIVRVVRVKRIDQGVSRRREKQRIVALHGFVEKREPQ